MGLRIAVVAGDVGHVERCLAGPETALRGHAVGAAVRLGVPAVAAQVDTFPAAVRRKLYGAVRGLRRTELADPLLPRVRARFGDAEAVAVLPACSGPVVAAALPELSYAVGSWGALAHRHPVVVLDHIEAELDSTPRARWPEMGFRLGQVLGAVAAAAPDRVLAVLERTEGLGMPSAVAGVLARHDAARLLRVLLDPRRVGPLPTGRALWRALLGCADADLAALGRVLRGDQVPGFLRVLPPARRAAVYAGVLGERDLVSANVPFSVLDELPRAARAAEAERLLALRGVADDPKARLAVAARTAWAKAAPVLAEATRRSTADERAEAYPLAIAAAAGTRDPDSFGTFLASLTRLRNEQEPVRAAALTALAEAPPWLIRDADVPVVIGLVTDATEARDRSWLSDHAIRTLSTRLIREGAVSRRQALVDGGVAALERLGETAAWLDLHRLNHALPRGAEHEVFAALRPRIDAEARQGRFVVALSLAAGLGKRAWDMPELQAFVDRARRAKDDRTVGQAIGLWLAAPATRGERVEQVLRADPSTITFHAVRKVIARHRTDLLDNVFSGPLHGRFLRRGVRHIPFFHGCFHAWLPRQNARYVRLLADFARNKSVPLHERVAATRTLRGVPGSAAALRQLVRAEEVSIAESAMAALAWTDEPADVLPDLIAWANTDRARVAVYAVGRCARFVMPEPLGRMLEPLLTSQKVTSRKEAVRLAVEHRVPGAAAVAAGVFRAPSQHRDVRRAVVSACRLLLDEPVAWEILAEATTDERAVATAVVETARDAVPERHRARYAELVRAVAASTDPDTALRGLSVLPVWSRWDTGGPGVLVDLVTDLAMTATWRQAVWALAAHAGTTDDPAPLLAAARGLLAAGETGGPDRDLPARQRLLELVRVVADAAVAGPGRPLAVALSDLLTDVEDYRDAAVTLALAAAPVERADPAPLLAAHALAVTPVLRWRASRALRTRLREVVHRLPQDDLPALAHALAADAPAFALAVAQVAGTAGGWTAPLRDVLAGLRAHPDQDVRRAALDTFTVAE